jgi:acetoacetyl-CoA synthetase
LTAALREVEAGMFDDVCGLLEDFENPAIRYDEWRRLLDYPWRRPAEHSGYALVDDAAVVGFLGLVFGELLVRGRPERFCNLTSWIVKPGYRNQGLRLLAPVLRTPATLTMLTPSPSGHALCRRLGFRDLHSAAQLVPALPPLPRLGRRSAVRIDADPGVVRAALAPEHRRIFDDHSALGCAQLRLYDASGRSCYVVARKRSWGRRRVCQVHYASDPELLAPHAHAVAWALFCLYGRPITLVEERFLAGRTVPLAARRSLKFPPLYRSERLEPADVPNLYSELVLLPL